MCTLNKNRQMNRTFHVHDAAIDTPIYSLNILSWLLCLYRSPRVIMSVSFSAICVLVFNQRVDMTLWPSMESKQILLFIACLCSHHSYPKWTVLSGQLVSQRAWTIYQKSAPDIVPEVVPEVRTGSQNQKLYRKLYPKSEPEVVPEVRTASFTRSQNQNL